MAKLPQLSGKEMGRILVRLGFVFKSQRGGHMKFILYILDRLMSDILLKNLASLFRNKLPL